MAIRAVIFDLGGVIVRTENRTPRRELAEEFGMTYEQMDDLVFNSPSAVQAAMGQLPAEEHWRSVGRQLGVPEAKLAAMEERFWGGDRVDQDMVAYIRSLRPRYLTALLSNAWSSLRRYLEHPWKILDAFDEVVISAEVGLAKPDPRIYTLIASRLEVSPHEAVFVDDFIENVQAAREAGLAAVHFQGWEQARRELESLL